MINCISCSSVWLQCKIDTMSMLGRINMKMLFTWTFSSCLQSFLSTLTFEKNRKNNVSLNVHVQIYSPWCGHGLHASWACWHIVYTSCIVLLQKWTSSNAKQSFPLCTGSVFKVWSALMSCSCFPSPMHFCCCCMSLNATNVCQIAWVSPGSLFSPFFFAYALWYFGFYPPSNTLFMWWWVVFFTTWVVSSLL